MVVYKITNKISGKLYIGQTVQKVSTRWIQHKCDAKTRKYHSVLHRAMNKHGIENFEIKIIARCNSMEEMNHREAYYINTFNTLAPNGYNAAEGGKNHRLTDAQKIKLSKLKMGVKTGKTWNKGISPSYETRMKIKYASTGKRNGMYGKCHSEETKKKIAEKRKGTKSPAHVIENLAAINRRPVTCNENGMIFRSAKEAAKYFSITPQAVTGVVKKQRKQCYGLTFSYYNKPNKD